MNILIVKLGAMGDVIRTTPLLRAYKTRYPDARVTWLVDPYSQPILAQNPLIDELVTTSEIHAGWWASRRFDMAINLDKEAPALDAIAQARSERKWGFGWGVGRQGIAALNPESEYAVRLGLDDELKFRLNQKSYQEISFEQAGFKFAGEAYEVPLSDANVAYAQRFYAGLAKTAAPVKWIGINIGSGSRFAGKSLPESTLLATAVSLAASDGVRVVLLGGPEERERMQRFKKILPERVYAGGTDHAIMDFAAIISRLSVLLTGDTTAMHLAIAYGVPVVTHFGSTCAPEIHLYGRGVKIVSTLPCAPCYKKSCPIDEQCMKDVKPEELVSKARSFLHPAGALR